MYIYKAIDTKTFLWIHTIICTPNLMNQNSRIATGLFLNHHYHLWSTLEY